MAHREAQVKEKDNQIRQLEDKLRSLGVFYGMGKYKALSHTTDILEWRIYQGRLGL